MADEEKAKAEKLAAARKRVEQMKKQKGKKSGKKDKDTKEEAAADSKPENESKAETSTSAAEASPAADAPAEDEATAEDLASPSAATASLSLQSKLRSSSFRQGNMSPMSPTGMPLSPEGETAPDIYRKQVARIEDLEKENKRLAKEAGDAEKRWKKAEEELTDLREADRDGSDNSLVEKMKSENAALQRQVSQLQSAATKRHGSSPSMSMASPPAELQAQLDSKSATIETMELEISRLRAQAERQATAGGTDREQITALEEKLARAEQSAMKAQRELGDLKRNLERTTERVVKEGSARTSAETKARTLEREVEELTSAKAELEKKVEALDKKVAALGTLHKENDSRAQALRKEKEKAETLATEATARAERLEAENARLRKTDAADGGGDNPDLDELESDQTRQQAKKIRDLEAEIYDLRRGIWHQRRRDMEPGAEDAAEFTNVDLGGGGLASPTGAGRKSVSGRGLGDILTSGINALTGAGEEDKDEFLEDDDMEFDEDAFRRAQEEEGRRRLERIRELKRGLSNWQGWRLDLVDSRRGGGLGVGEVFEI
ncbi:hypothetical protein F4780DRAFT_726708 [Xylariomycetidae sp. FL0641]|nr:hypothetical protein F4780DRAFT_726708 [Xylariomycetidae sp. FL0641]